MCERSERHYRDHHHCYEVSQVRVDEHKEVFVVPVAEAVVEESAVMIKLLDTSLTEIAVEGPPRFDQATIETEVFEVDTFIICESQELLF